LLLAVAAVLQDLAVAVVQVDLKQTQGLRYRLA
jgi:hypothetical protein